MSDLKSYISSKMSCSMPPRGELEDILKKYPWFTTARITLNGNKREDDPILVLHYLCHSSKTINYVSEEVSGNSEASQNTDGHIQKEQTSISDGYDSTSPDTISEQQNTEADSKYRDVTAADSEDILSNSEAAQQNCEAESADTATGTEYSEPEKATRSAMPDATPEGLTPKDGDFQGDNPEMVAMASQAVAADATANIADNTGESDLIETFLQKGEHRITPTDDTPEEDVSERSSVLDLSGELLSEELAEIYRAQGLNAEAKKIYEQLSLVYPEKSVYFAEIIGEIESGNK